MIIDISPVQVSHECTKIEVIMPTFNLGATEGFVYVNFMTVNGAVVRSEMVTIPESVYVDWGVDDTYIVNYVMSELNIIAA